MKSKNIIYRKDFFIKYLLVFLLSWIPRLILALFAIPIKSVSDDVALLSTAAFFAGNDWSNVVSHAGYYGFGYYGLFFWLFRMELEPETIFRVIVVFISLMQALAAPICMYIMHHEFKITNAKYCFAVSVLVSYLVVNRVCTVSNEHPINLLVWLVVLILCRILNNENTLKRAQGGMLLVTLLIYGLTIHTRNIVICITVVLGIIIYMLVYQYRFVFSKKIVIKCIYIGILYILIHNFILYIQRQLWRVGDSEALRNATYSISINENLSVIDIIKAWYCIIIGQISAINFFTIGMSAFLIIMIGEFLVNNLKKRNGTNVEKCLFLLAVILILSVGAMILGQSLSWLSGVAKGIKSGEYSTVYAFKAFSYLRYFMPFIGPLCMVGMVICYYKRDDLNRILGRAQLFSCLIFIQWIIFILPKLKNNPEGFTTSLAGLGIVKRYSDVNEINYFFMFHICVLSFFLLSFLLKKKKIKPIFLILIGVMVYQYFFCAYYSDRLVSKQNYKMVNAGHELLAKIQDEENITFPLIYVFDSSERTDHQNFYMYQFYFPYSTIIPTLPDDVAEDVIIISNVEMEDQIGDEYFAKSLDENEYIYLGEGKYSDIIKKYLEDSTW